MKSHKINLALATMTAFAALAGTSSADETKPVRAAFVEDIGAQERINYSGKLRMLSQRIPSAACHLAKGIDPEGARTLLQGATTEFEKILTGLEFGDADLKIVGSENRRKTVAQIHDLRGKWEPMKAAAEAMIAGDTSPANLDAILSQNMIVLASAKILVSDLVAQYSDPASMLQSHSMLIDISGRQRMLTQKMSKESCIVASGLGTAETVEHLQGTMSMFEVSLTALMGGMPDAGIIPPPNGDISSGLNTVYFNWNEIKPTLEAVVAGASVDDGADTAKFQNLNTAMANMNKVVGMYTAAAKMGL